LAGIFNHRIFPCIGLKAVEYYYLRSEILTVVKMLM
jgi:hypothetical protein